MNTVAQQRSSGRFPIGSVAQRIAAVREEATQVRGFRLRGPVDDEWGQSESVDPDNVGDIADEGAGHRG
jgi:hypothetical protein